MSTMRLQSLTMTTLAMVQLLLMVPNNYLLMFLDVGEITEQEMANDADNEDNGKLNEDILRN